MECVYGIVHETPSLISALAWKEICTRPCPDYIHHKMWDKISYPYLNFNNSTISYTLWPRQHLQNNMIEIIMLTWFYNMFLPRKSGLTNGLYLTSYICSFSWYEESHYKYKTPWDQYIFLLRIYNTLSSCWNSLMMTSSNGNSFRVTGLSEGNPPPFTGGFAS